MSRVDVEAVFGPQWSQNALAYERRRATSAQEVVLALRRKLRATDPSLPNEHDGMSWQPIEAEFITPR